MILLILSILSKKFSFSSACVSARGKIQYDGPSNEKGPPMRKSFWVIVAFAALAAAGAKLPPLAMALRPGAGDVYRISVDTDDELRLRGDYVKKYESHQVFDVDEKVLPSTSPNDRPVQITIKRIRLQTDVAGGQIVRFDSDERPDGMAEYHRPLIAMLNRPLTLHVDATGHIPRVDGFDEIAAAVRSQTAGAQVSADMLDAFQTHYGPDFIADIFEIFYASLPPAAAPTPAQWQRHRTVYNAFLGKLAFAQTCKLEESDDDALNKMSFHGVIRPEEQDRTVKQQLPHAGIDLKLRSGSVDGEIEVDRSGGSLDRLQQETVLLLALDNQRADAPAGQRVTQRTFIERE